MKKVLLLGYEKDLGETLARRMNVRGYSIREIRNMNKVLKFLKLNSPDFVLCTGKIQIDQDGNYYLEF